MATILRHGTTYAYGDDNGDDVVVEVVVRYISCPAEPDVGIMFPYLEWVDVLYPHGDKDKHPAPTNEDYEIWTAEIDGVQYDYDPN